MQLNLSYKKQQNLVLIYATANRERIANDLHIVRMSTDYIDYINHDGHLPSSKYFAAYKNSR